MKITKRQLKRIIKEEKAKVLFESGAIANANRALGLYADVTTTESIANSILDTLAEVEYAAHDDGAMEDEAEAMARSATILAVANAFQSAGLVDVYEGLMRMLQR